MTPLTQQLFNDFSADPSTGKDKFMISSCEAPSEVTEATIRGDAAQVVTCRYTKPGTRVEVNSATCQRTPYAISGTDKAYGAICLSARYAMSGTDIVHGATRFRRRSYALCASPQRIVLPGSTKQVGSNRVIAEVRNRRRGRAGAAEGRAGAGAGAGAE
eukprot:2320638-Rhodomonas_salina.4